MIFDLTFFNFIFYSFVKKERSVTQASLKTMTYLRGLKMTFKIKLELDQSSIDFLNNYEAFGFKDKKAMIKKALNCLKNQLELERLRESCDLYAAVTVEKTDSDDLFEFLQK